MSRYRIEESKRAIGYYRVSTEGQGESGIGLEGQRIAVSEYAHRTGRTILESFQDVLSGWGRDNLERRPGLQSAIAAAKARRVPIIVSDIDRISRQESTIFDISAQEGIVIISASHGVMTSPEVLASSAARAEYERTMISTRTREALQIKKRAGAKLGNRTNLPDAQRKGMASNIARREAMVVQIADVLAGVDEHGTLKAKDVVELLNSRGILTGHNKRWTESAIRRPLRQARKLLENRERKETYRDNPDFGRF
ncbi:recombinase family protein [Mesorhizobium sp.]|uniref:recombinase family protein n=1 Tax=Mesorhizobium sp. TaxID=1871066 RepID=UPI000FE96651|nr:recombinase family protein [Mesorhizobium sp.]RWK41132.1 MAG: recombinase family protein [Mesorhizobium sp.]RWK67779.1 MAG: recombinase family protein [Mesorhizobium sp.]RWK78120.1 MAG: recombinase family protein [Mesorhizobium sp.]RWK80430.1 MAG: recombinase family protein [Mesorhizobium sp.]RWL03882.1 MAG: recombinase family protein [Mesorhizobium sp.]